MAELNDKISNRGTTPSSPPLMVQDPRDIYVIRFETSPEGITDTSHIGHRP